MNIELWETAEHPGLFLRLGAEGIHVSMSTISPETGRRLARQHAERGGTYVASPVMGRPDAVAARGQLYLVSGPASRWHAMLSETIFACPIYKNYGKLILDGDYRRPLFQLALGLKDLGLVSQVAFESRTPMPLASLLRDRFLAAFAHGRGNWDWMSIAAEVEAQAGLEREAPTG